ncbi:MAG TPA: hypothetical protein VF100_08355, partial [Thermoanaerobaculia bacterium]
TGEVFDPLAAAATAAGLAVDALLHPQRAARLVDQHRRHPELPGLAEVLDGLVEAAFTPAESPRRAEVARSVQTVAGRGLLDLAADPAASPAASPAVRARTEAALSRLVDTLHTGTATSPADAAHRAWLARSIDRWLTRQHEEEAPPLPEPPEPPPGSPIGSAAG